MYSWMKRTSEAHLLLTCSSHVGAPHKIPETPNKEVIARLP